MTDTADDTPRSGPRSGPRSDPRPGPTLDHVETWIFDLDNTLYPASCNLFAQVDRRMGEFIARLLDLDHAAARTIQKRYFRDYGTTLNGLMQVHGIAPGEFLSYVHDIDLSVVPENPDLAASLDRLDGRKMIYTNGSVAHAERVMARLGIADRFEAVVDIVASDYRPKPDPRPYEAMIARLGFDPRRAAMVEDMHVNLAPAHALGMSTVWVTDSPGASGQPPEAPGEHVHHIIPDVADWLAELTAARRS